MIVEVSHRGIIYPPSEGFPRSIRESVPPTITIITSGVCRMHASVKKTHTAAAVESRYRNIRSVLHPHFGGKLLIVIPKTSLSTSACHRKIKRDIVGKKKEIFHANTESHGEIIWGRHRWESDLQDILDTRMHFLRQPSDLVSL